MNVQRFTKLLIGLFFLILSCTSSTQPSEEEQLYQEVMELHDEIMPEMNKINSLSKRLKNIADSLQKIGDDNGKLDRIQVQVNQLASANESMMNWMRNLKPEYEGNDSLSRKEYLEIEKDKIGDVGNEFEEVIKSAEETLASLNEDF